MQASLSRVMVATLHIVFSLRWESFKLILVDKPFPRWFCHTCFDLLGTGSYLILISSLTRIHMIFLLNRTCISLMLLCVCRSLLRSKEDLLSLPDALPGHLTRVLTRVLPERLTQSGYSYPALPYLLTWLGNSLSALSRNLLPEPIACQCKVFLTQLSPHQRNLVYTLPDRQPIFYLYRPLTRLGLSSR
jgi:hypothetical protein